PAPQSSGDDRHHITSSPQQPQHIFYFISVERKNIVRLMFESNITSLDYLKCCDG
ncbi:29533_t:CDS:1, partial [Racocetra persica]